MLEAEKIKVFRRSKRNIGKDVATNKIKNIYIISTRK